MVLNNKRVLMAGFHFPPSTLSSGHLRPLAFAEYLPEFGWEPLVLTTTALAYEQKNAASVRTIPAACRVFRAPAIDAKRHLGIRGKYPAFLARPDRWISWWPSAICTGLYIIKRYRPIALWSTYPIMTTNLVAYTLHRLTGIPWIADFRDPVMTTARGSPNQWEHRIVSTAAYSVFTAPGAKQSYAEHYPEIEHAGRFVVIGNGYDEKLFNHIATKSSATSKRPLVLLHSGVLYPDGRDPEPLFAALARLKDSGVIRAGTLQVVLRASGLGAHYKRKLQELELQDIVKLAPQVSNRKALEEQAHADALLLLQGEKFDRQIPAKVYEYLRIGQPIVALVGENGDSAQLLRETGGATIAPLNDAASIEAALRGFLKALAAGNAPRVDPQKIGKYSRRASTAALAQLLDQSIDDHST